MNARSTNPNDSRAGRDPRRRILVRGVNWLGDAVMTTPALLRLREAMPDAQITLLTHEKLAGLWSDHPALDAVMTFSQTEPVWRIGTRLRERKFDSALVLPNSPRSALEVWLGAIPERVGYARPWRNWCLTRTVDERRGAVRMHKRTLPEIQQLIAAPEPPGRLPLPALAHHIHQYLHLAAALGANPVPLAPRLHVSEAQAEAVARKFHFADASPGEPLFGLNPGAEYGPAKRWPRDRFASAAIELQQRVNCRWLIFGGKNDVELGEWIIAELRHSGAPEHCAINLAGATTLHELCAALKGCRLLLTNDTGPMHVAAALGTPVIVPFGSTSPELTGPSQDGPSPHVLLRSDAPCAPCFLRECPIDFRCMTGIKAGAVVEACLKIHERI